MIKTTPSRDREISDGGNTLRYGGSGLGLAIAKQLAELLGGLLTATSKKGRGSVFSLVIPAGVNVAEQPTLDRNNTADHRDGKKEKSEPSKLSGHVLVAEDVKTNQMLYKWT